MKVDELRVLEADELNVRLRTSRRELYELRFKHAVGQLDNSSQIKKVRHDLARIMTVLRERDLGIGPTIEEAQQLQATAIAEAEPQPEPKPAEEEAKPKRTRRGKKIEEQEEETE